MKLITPSPTAWDSYLAGRESGHFLQSWAWGDFQEKLGNKVWRIAVEDGGSIVAQLLVIKLSLGFGQSILYSPRGSVIDKSQSLATAQTSGVMLLDEVKKIGQAEGVVFFRIDPPTAANEIAFDRFYASHGFVKNPKNIQPKHSLILNLGPSLEQLLNRMKPKTRYNIHLAEKHGVTIAKSTQASDLNYFLALTRATSSRQGFSAHSDTYYRTQFNTLNPAGIQELWLARQADKIISAILVNYFGQTATYVHGASDNAYRDLMAPHLLQFTNIADAKTKGFKYYDFWGIHPDPRHPWAGFTRFKRGFDGDEIEYIGMLELPFKSFLYRLYRLISKLH